MSESTDNAFDAGAYWQDRVVSGADLSVVGHRSMGPEYNRHIYERRLEVLDEMLARHSAKPDADLRVLDIGCGGGILSESIARLGARVTGIDVVEKNIRIARLHAIRQGLEVDYRAVTAAQQEASGERYDVVLNMEVVEHVADLPAFMSSACALAAPGGVMFVATINRTPKSWLFAKIGAEYILRLLPRGTHRWRMFRRPVEVRALLQRGGLDVAETTGVGLNPLTRRFWLARSLQVNYMLMASY